MTSFKKQKMAKTVISLFSSTFLGLIFVLMDSVSYGRGIFPTNCFKEDQKPLIQNISMIIFLSSTIVSQIVFGLVTKMQSGILSSFIVEGITFYLQIFTQIYNDAKKNDECNIPFVLSNTLACTSLSTFLFAVISLLLSFFEIGKYLSFIPKSALMGCFGAIGISQFSVAFSEIGLGDFETLFQNRNVVLLLITVFLISIFALILQEKFPDFIILIPLYTISVCGLFYLASYIFGYSMNDLRAIKWLPTYEKTNLKLEMITENIKFNNIKFKYITLNISAILNLTLLNLIHLPVNLSTYGVETGLKTDLPYELFTQAVGNFFTTFLASPSYFVCSNSIFFRRSGGKTKLSSIIMGITIPILFYVGTIVKNYSPVVLLAFFPFFIGLCICYSVFVTTYSILKETENMYDYIILVVTGLVSYKMGPVEGIILGTLLNIMVFISNYNCSLKSRNNEKKEDFVVDNNENYILVDYILFFGSIKYLLNRIDELCEGNGKNKMIIDLTKCWSMDWLAKDMLMKKIDEKKISCEVIGNPRNFNMKNTEEVVWYKTIEDYKKKSILEYNEID